MNCPYCGSENTDYQGIADGAGDYGDGVVDEWFCNYCHTDFEGDDVFDDGVIIMGGAGCIFGDLPRPSLTRRFLWFWRQWATRTGVMAHRIAPDDEELPF